jgi:hypothetical protein
MTRVQTDARMPSVNREAPELSWTGGCHASGKQSTKHGVIFLLCVACGTYHEALERSTHDYLSPLKPRTQERYRTSFPQPTGGIIRPVQKSPSLTVVESWLSTVVFAGLPTVPGTIRFRVRECPPQAGNRLRRSGRSQPRSDHQLLSGRVGADRHGPDRTDICHAQRDQVAPRRGPRPPCRGEAVARCRRQALEIVSSARPRVRGPKPPIEITTISMAKAMKMNTAFTPPRFSR